MEPLVCEKSAFTAYKFKYTCEKEKENDVHVK